jgi:hypothetical protein
LADPSSFKNAFATLICLKGCAPHLFQKKCICDPHRPCQDQSDKDDDDDPAEGKERAMSYLMKKWYREKDSIWGVLCRLRPCLVDCLCSCLVHLSSPDLVL